MNESIRTEEDRIIKECSAVLPSVALCDLLGLQRNALLRKQTALGVNNTLKQSKAITKSFLAELPNLNVLPLTDSQRKQVRLFRLMWIEQRSRDGKENDRRDTILFEYSSVLPTRALAAVLEISRGSVKHYQKHLGIEISRSDMRRMQHRFASAPKAPTFSFFDREERARLNAEWRRAHDEYLESQKAREKTSEATAKRMFKDLCGLRELLRANHVMAVESPCSGECGESWPRTSDFFTSNFRSQDKLSNRCHYCVFLSSLARKKKKSPAKKRSRGRRLSKTEEIRLKEIIGKYSYVIPGELLRTLFSIGEATLARLRIANDIRLTMKSSRKITWRWILRDALPDLDLLSDEEYAKLILLTRSLRKEMLREYEWDEVHGAMLAEEAEAFREAHNDVPVEEVNCRRCERSFPKDKQFLPSSGKYLDRLCKTCKNYEQGQRRLAERKKRVNGE